MRRGELGRKWAKEAENRAFARLGALRGRFEKKGGQKGRIEKGYTHFRRGLKEG